MTFPSYACGSQSEHLAFFLMDRSGQPHAGVTDRELELTVLQFR
jgi:hypothetical protein